MSLEYVLGGLALLAGCGWCWLRCQPRSVSGERMAFHRAEQMARLRDLLRRPGLALRRGRATSP